jgi:hypothetical protein
MARTFTYDPILRVQMIETLSHEADNYVYRALIKRKLPTTLMPVSLSCPQMSATRVAHALARLAKQNVIVAQSSRLKGVTYWRIEEINPPDLWKKSKHIIIKEEKL